MIEQTLAIIKPDAVSSLSTGPIIELIERNGFSIKRMEKRKLDKATAERFYDVHKSKPFFTELVDFITSGTAVLMILEKERAIADWRELMGATDPLKAACGTIRKMFGVNIGKNATHGSDALSTAEYEIGIIFPEK